MGYKHLLMWEVDSQNIFQFPLWDTNPNNAVNGNIVLLSIPFMGYKVGTMSRNILTPKLSIPFMGYNINKRKISCCRSISSFNSLYGILDKSIILTLSLCKNFQFPLWDTLIAIALPLPSKSIALSIPFMGYYFVSNVCR